jgi:hypothetical protein
MWILITTVVTQSLIGSVDDTRKAQVDMLTEMTRNSGDSCNRSQMQSYIGYKMQNNQKEAQVILLN